MIFGRCVVESLINVLLHVYFPDKCYVVNQYGYIDSVCLKSLSQNFRTNLQEFIMMLAAQMSHRKFIVISSV